jgi:osmotically-inducible protein OsmY
MHRSRLPILALVVAGLLCGCALYRKSPDDPKITARVETLLGQHTSLDGVSVQTLNHVVYLSGMVDSSAAIDAAESLARQADGVTHVESVIQFSP